MANLEDIYDEEEEQRRAALIIFPRYQQMLRAVHIMVASAFPEVQDFLLDDLATRKMLAHAAERVVMIDESTRRSLREVLQEGQRRGYSDVQIADGVPSEDFGGIKGLYLETWKSRAITIARTELSEAQVHATLDRYAATGLVSRVQLVEHRDTDEQCAQRNGQIVPLAQRPGLAHPNCRLALVPVVDDVA